MNIKSPIHIVLSRRNLLTLIKYLDKKVGMPSIFRQTSYGRFIVEAEEDEQHYGSTDREQASRGRMGVGPEDVG